MNRFKILLIINLCLFSTFVSASTKPFTKTALITGRYIGLDNCNIMYLEISPDLFAENSKEKRWSYHYNTKEISEAGALKLSDKNHVGTFRIGTDDFTVNWGKTEEGKCVLLKINGKEYQLMEMNNASEYDNGIFIDQKSTTSFEVNPAERDDYDTQLLNIGLFEGRFDLPNSQDFFYGFTIPSPVKNHYYFCSNDHQIYNLIFNPKEHTYTLCMDKDTLNYLYSFSMNHNKINAGEFFFESAIAGKCEIERVGDSQYVIQITFNSEVRKKLKVVTLNVHTEGNKLVLDSSTGIEASELTVWLSGQILEIGGIQEDKIYINTGKKDLFED